MRKPGSTPQNQPYPATRSRPMNAQIGIPEGAGAFRPPDEALFARPLGPEPHQPRTRAIPQSQEGSAGLPTGVPADRSSSVGWATGCSVGVPARARAGATTQSSSRNTLSSPLAAPFSRPAPAQPTTSKSEALPQAPRQAGFPPSPRSPRRANPRTWETHAMPTFGDQSAVNERTGDFAAIERSHDPNRDRN
jgi:hypothetical protein